MSMLLFWVTFESGGIVPSCQCNSIVVVHIAVPIAVLVFADLYRNGVCFHVLYRWVCLPVDLDLNDLS